MFNMQYFLESFGFKVTAATGIKVKEKDFFKEVRLYKKKKGIFSWELLNIANLIFDLRRAAWIRKKDKEKIGNAHVIYCYHQQYMDELVILAYYFSQKYQHRLAVFNDNCVLVGLFYPLE